jgi:hypothetical protein
VLSSTGSFATSALAVSMIDSLAVEGDLVAIKSRRGCTAREGAISKGFVLEELSALGVTLENLRAEKPSLGSARPRSR